MKQLLAQASHAYTPEGADAGRPLRAVVSYADRHGPGKEAVAELPHPVVGPVLSALAARTDSGRSLSDAEEAAMRPASTTNRYVHLDDATLGQAAELVVAIHRKLFQDRTGSG